MCIPLPLVGGGNGKEGEVCCIVFFFAAWPGPLFATRAEQTAGKSDQGRGVVEKSDKLPCSCLAMKKKKRTVKGQC